MKKLPAILLALVLLLGLCACGEKEPEPSEAPETAEPSPEPSPEPEISGTYTYEFDGMMGKETAQLEFTSDGLCRFSLPGNTMITDVYEGSYTRKGDKAEIKGLENTDPASPYKAPGLWDWIVDGNAAVTLDDASGSFVPDGAGQGKELPSAGQESGETSDVAYAFQSPTQVCDIHMPQGDGPFPVIVLVHGGGFAFGDQKMPIIQPAIEAGTENGYAVVSVDYRKSSEAVFPAALADVKAAVRFVRANAEEYGFDSEHIAIWGESAGAYLSLMTALTPEVPELEGDVTDNSEVSSSVNALVSFYAPVEFYVMDNEYAALGRTDSSFAADDSFESKFLGQNIGLDKEKTYTTYWESYTDKLPADFTLSAWIQAGSGDQRVPYTQSENFASRLKDVIGEENVRFGIIEGADHEDAQFYTDENLSEVFAFLDAVLKP